MVRNRCAHFTGMLVLSLLASCQVFAQSQEQTDEQDLVRTIQEMQVRISALENQLVLKGAEQINNTLQDLQAQVTALQNEARKVRVQTGRVHINRIDIPELFQPNCNGHIERGEKHGRVDFQESFASPPKVIMGLSAIDVSHNANSRFHVIAISVDTEGFDYKFYTWCDAAIHSAEAHWIAVAQ